MFNKSVNGKTKTENFEGAEAYNMTAELELYSLVCTDMFSDKYYEGNKDRLNRLRKLIKDCDDEFVCKLAVYAREKMYLRTIPMVLLVELLKSGSKYKDINKAITKCIDRADEITEILSYYQLANDRSGTKKLNKLSKKLQKGISDAFYKFDEYQFSKYNRDKEIKLRDALFLTHPKPMNDSQIELFKKISEDKLGTPYTWEVQLSEEGKLKKGKKEIWEELIDSNKLGYMALIRNLRNILDVNVSTEHIKKVSEYIRNESNVLKSRQLPFRFLSAYNEISNNNNIYTSEILESLEKAIQISFSNINGYGIDTSVLIASDVSGSMEHSITPKSTIQLYDIGLLLSMGLQTKCKASITGIFGDIFSVDQMPKTNILQNVRELHRIEGKVGYSTNGYKVIEYLIDKKLSIDKIMIFTDCQMWNSYNSTDTFKKSWSEYKKINPNAKLYLFDLSGHGTTPVSTLEPNVYFISGWSDKVFDMLDALEKSSSVINEIKKISF